jgi:signal transduction histidine kinase
MSSTASVTRPDIVYVAQAFEFLVCAVAAVVLVRQQRVRRSPATGWALAMFCVLALILAAGVAPVTDDGSALRHGYTVVLISVLLLIPYILVRFALSLGALSARVHVIAATLTVLQIAATLGSPRFPQEGQPRTTWFSAYVVLILIAWTYQSVIAAWGLWAAGKGQPSVVRHRMRALSAGAVVLALALVTSGSSSKPSTATQVVTTVIGALGIYLLMLAFVVPSWLRAAWRASDLSELGLAERRLMTAETPKEVAAAIVPAVVRLFGARGAALLDLAGAPITVQGLARRELVELYPEMLAAPPGDPVVVTDGGVFGCRLSQGWLVVKAGAFAPLFGPGELTLLDRIGSFVDLALQRCRLFEEEARSRAAAEAATAELQTLLYSVSHDLRNPIISVLGYLDVLAQEHAGQLQGEGEHYLQRISVNAMYMQSLIQDLLELSRIGRSQPAPQAVPMGLLAESVAQEIRALHPECEIAVEGEFPVLWISELRARQLLTNLLDNAAKHSSVEAKRVQVRAVHGDSGGTTLLVIDNGGGIAEAYREKAFDVFERLDAARSDVPGTGMGLPICKRIVESVNGSISLEGPPAGSPHGTTVRIELPPSVVQGWTPALPALEKETTP